MMSQKEPSAHVYGGLGSIRKSSIVSKARVVSVFSEHPV